MLLVKEAGGSISHFNGGKFTLDSREVLATNGLIQREMQTLFTDMFAGKNLEPIPTPAEFAAMAGGKERKSKSALRGRRSDRDV